MVISKTPLRMSFFGGGTDFKDYYENSKFGYGATISTAVNMYLYITVNKRMDKKIRLVYQSGELVDNVDEIKHNIIRNALKIVGIENGIEIIYTADLPIAGVGIGMASSSAMSVGLLNALHAFKGEYASPEQLAKEACKLEIEMMQQPIGIQDQYAVAYGGFNRYKFERDGNVVVEPVICDINVLKNLKSNLMLFFTGITRDSGTILGEQKKNINDKTNQLDKLVLAVDEAYQALQNKDIDRWGCMLDETWKTKKQLASKISNPIIDKMYNDAISAGALGGKVLGAGGGGFLLLYVPKCAKDDVRKALKNYDEIKFDFSSYGSQIIFKN